MNFIFEKEDEARAVNMAEVPSGIQSKAALLDALFVALRFPDYFGGNWDALDECIRDLSWLPHGDVVLRHKDLPLLEDRPALSTYLAILNDAVGKWSASGERNFVVVFPPETRCVVQNILVDAQGA